MCEKPFLLRNTFWHKYLKGWRRGGSIFTESLACCRRLHSKGVKCQLKSTRNMQKLNIPACLSWITVHFLKFSYLWKWCFTPVMITLQHGRDYILLCIILFFPCPPTTFSVLFLCFCCATWVSGRLSLIISACEESHEWAFPLSASRLLPVFPYT